MSHEAKIQAALKDESQSLNQVLHAIGYSKDGPGVGIYTQRISDENGEHVGDMTADMCWRHLAARAGVPSYADRITAERAEQSQLSK